MTDIRRRTFLQVAAGAAACAGLARAANPNLQIGITDWNLKMTTNPAAVALAARLGFAGVQVSCGRKVVGGKLPLDNPELIANMRLRRQSKSRSMALAWTSCTRTV